MKDIISIVVPVYNSEMYLQKCIESILSQTFSNIQLILVNDGSSDNSYDICYKYSKLDNRIKLISIQNQGVSNARNIGIKNANGKYIMFCDSDDYVECNWCELLYNSIEKNKDSLVICGYKIIDKKSIPNKSNNIIFNKNHSKNIINKKEFFSIYEKSLLNNPINKIYLRDIIVDNNILFKKDLSLGEDLIFNLEYLKYVSEEIVILNKTPYYYINRNSESLNNKYYENLFEIQTYLSKQIYKYMNLYNSDIKLYEERYYINYFHMIEAVLKNTFSEDNKHSLLWKIKYNNYILNQESVKKSIGYLRDEDVGEKYLKVLKMRNYYFIWILNKLSFIKNKLICRK